jgi:ABC-type iron transport system FetAB permease component
VDFTQTCLNSDWYPEIFEIHLLNVCDEVVWTSPIRHRVELLVLDFVVSWVLAFPTTSLVFRLAAIGVCRFKLY